jgi:hypothetical protein
LENIGEHRRNIKTGFREKRDLDVTGLGWGLGGKICEDGHFSIIQKSCTVVFQWAIQ